MTPHPSSVIDADAAEELLEVFGRLDAAAGAAAQQVAGAIVSHGSPVVAEALGVCHQTALRWARHGIRVPTASPTGHIEEVVASLRQDLDRGDELTHDPEPAGPGALEL